MTTVLRVWIEKPGQRPFSGWLVEAEGAWQLRDHWGSSQGKSWGGAGWKDLALKALGPNTQIVTPGLPVGTFHPRFWRRFFSPPPRDIYRQEWRSSVQAARVLFQQVKKIFEVVEPNASNSTAYGHAIRHALLLACMEVESAWRAVLTANGYLRDRFTTNDYVKLSGPMRLSEWRVEMQGFPSLPPVAPFASWSASAPTATLPWYDSYNAVKHDRENEFPKANLGNMIAAVAAVFVMTTAQFGSAWVERRNDWEQAEELHSEADDLFRVVKAPYWPLEEHYVPPSLVPGTQWSPTQYQF